MEKFNMNILQEFKYSFTTRLLDSGLFKSPKTVLCFFWPFRASCSLSRNGDEVHNSHLQFFIWCLIFIKSVYYPIIIGIVPTYPPYSSIFLVVSLSECLIMGHSFLLFQHIFINSLGFSLSKTQTYLRQEWLSLILLLNCPKSSCELWLI